MVEIRDIKQALRGMMNGIVSHSMREKGANYKVNFGVELPRLQAFAEELRASLGEGGRAYRLALQLWNEPIRECRLLAGMLMPVAEMDRPTSELWVEQMQLAEEAECTVFHLFQHLPYAADLAFGWIASERPMHQLCGWLLMARLFMQGKKPSERDAAEILDQAAVCLASPNLQLASAAQKAVLKYMALSPEAEARGEKLLGQ